jgi:hypothetical protein
MKIYARQGDVVIRQTQIMGDLISAVDLVVAGASSSPHTLVGKCGYRIDGPVTYVRVAAETTLAHAGRHLPVPMPAGDYALTSLRERGDKFDRAVED